MTERRQVSWAHAWERMSQIRSRWPVSFVPKSMQKSCHMPCSCYNIYSMHTLRTKYSCIRRSGLNSGWKLVAIFFPFLTATTRSASSSAGPRGPSDGGASAAKSGGSEHNGWKVASPLALSPGAREWIAGALMKMAGNGVEGSLSSGISS